VHRGADRVFGERGLDRVLRLLDFAGHFVACGIDDAFGGELLQDREAAAAGIDQINAFAGDASGVNDQVLQDALGADAGFKLCVFSLRGRVLRTLSGDRRSCSRKR
jgi:hypothetical protein